MTSSSRSTALVGIDLSAPLPFDEAARTTLRELQSALFDVVAGLPGADQAFRAVDLQRRLGLDKKLGWSLHKFVTAADPLVEVAHVPGEPSMRRILAAAARRRVPRASTERAAAAFERFEAFVAEHGGDRAELISLASGLASTGGSDQQHDLRTRRAVFKGLSHVWGIKAEMSIRTVCFAPDEGGAQQSMAVRAEIGLQRLRRNVPLTFVVNTRNNPKTSERELSPWVESSQTSGNPTTIGTHLLEAYCTQPLPRMLPRVLPDGDIETDVEFPPSGRSGAVTLYQMQHVRKTATGEQTRYSQGFSVRIPCEQLCLELLVPEGWSNPASVRVAVYGRRDLVDRAFERRTADLMPQSETATYLGTVETIPGNPAVPQHAAAMREALARVGWLGTRYDMYRCTVAYPVLHTMVSLDVDAAKR